MFNYSDKSRANINQKNPANGKTILHYAFEYGATVCVEELLKAKAAENIKDHQGLLPINLEKKQDSSFCLIL